MFGLIPREEAFFELFKNAAHNMIEGSRLLKEMMEHYQSPAEQAKRIKEVEHVGDGITHDIARRLNQTFITPIDREDIHDLASALDDILDVAEAIADRFVLYKVTKPTERAVKLADVCIRLPSQWEQEWTGWGWRIRTSKSAVFRSTVSRTKPTVFPVMPSRRCSTKKPIRWRSSSGKKFTRGLRPAPTVVKTWPISWSASR